MMTLRALQAHRRNMTCSDFYVQLLLFTGTVVGLSIVVGLVLARVDPFNEHGKRGR